MSWVKYAKPGDKVVCVLDVDLIDNNDDRDICPQKDVVYTIRAIEISEFDGEPYLYLKEIRNPPRFYIDGFGEASFHVEGFRPIESRPTDISVFTDMLNTAPAEELEKA